MKMLGLLRLLVGVRGLLLVQLVVAAALLPGAVSAEQPADAPPRVLTIGGVLSSEAYGERFTETIERINKEPGVLPPGIQLNSSYILMDDNPIRAANNICKVLIPKKVYVVIASHPPHSDLSPLAVSFTCGFYCIPVIGIAARNSAFSDKNVHTSFMRTVAPYSDQAVVWVEMVVHFQWKKVIFMHSSDEEGRAMLGRFQSKAEERGIEIEKNIQYIAGQVGFDEELLVELSTAQSRVVLLFASEEDAEHIYRDANRLNLTGAGYVWIVTEQALRPPNVPMGVLGLLQVDSDKEEAHINDSVRIIAQALKVMLKHENLSHAPSECNAVTKSFESGPTLFNYMKNEVLEKGSTGKLAFNDAGDRLNPVYKIINIQTSGHIKRHVDVGVYGGLAKKGEKLHMGDVGIIWPGNQMSKPKGIKISTHLKVVTIQALPFIYVDPVPAGGVCDTELNRMPCPRPNSTGGTHQDFCCYGYAIDLLVRLARTVNFTYNLHLVEDNKYGSYERMNGSKKEWNGMIGELVNGKADLIVAPLTMNPERAEHIDFSKPFKYQGLTILVKKTSKDSSLASFLQPFQDTLWILVGLSVHVVALVLYLLDRFSPFGRFKMAKSDDTEEDALNLSSAMWFAWGVLLNSGIGEGTPRSFSARVLGMVWAGFAMIIVASYTANLAAFLVLDRPEASISGIDDARLRNPQENFKYATVKNSAVAMYFKRQVELSTMYRTMESRNYESEEQAIVDVKEGRKLQAFIWDSSRLEYEAANDCDLVTAGELFGRSGYGIGLPKGSPWTQDISLAVLSFHESGYMEQLDGKWILVMDTKCPEKDTSPATLGLTNMAGVFMMVAGGIVAGVFLIFVEIAYKRHRGLKEKELELAKTAADRWRGNIEKRRTLRRTLLQQQERQKTNGTSGSPARPTLTTFGNKSPGTSVGVSGGTSVGGTSGYQRVPVSAPLHEVTGIGPV